MIFLRGMFSSHYGLAVRLFNVLVSRRRVGSIALQSRSSASGRFLTTFPRILAFTSSGKIFAVYCIPILLMYTLYSNAKRFDVGGEYTDAIRGQIPNPYRPALTRALWSAIGLLYAVGLRCQPTSVVSGAPGTCQLRRIFGLIKEAWLARAGGKPTSILPMKHRCLSRPQTDRAFTRDAMLLYAETPMPRWKKLTA